jgi:hypothetical protein
MIEEGRKASPKGMKVFLELEKMLMKLASIYGTIHFSRIGLGA